MWSKNKHCAAFTLLESLVALLVLSCSILLFQGLTTLVMQEVRMQSATSDKDWILFTAQLQAELEETQLNSITSQQLVVKKGQQGLAFGLSKSGDFRKTNEKGQGFQPMLYEVQSIEWTQQGRLVQLFVQFENGRERTFLYAFEKTS